jgi:CBS domain containing-hemolysin-like protein
MTTIPADIERLVLETGHSRFPIYGDSLDNVVGFFHSKDLLKIAPEEYERPLPGRFIRQMLVVPESRKLHPLLFDMRRQRRQFALVIDEHGGTSGVVTIEDLVEELVGEIRDEYDDAEFGIERLGHGRYLVPGSLRLHEAAERIGMELPEGEYETIAGFLMDRLQRIPQRGDEVGHGPWTIRVRTMHRRRVVQLLIEGPAQQAERVTAGIDEAAGT